MAKWGVVNQRVLSEHCYNHFLNIIYLIEQPVCDLNLILRLITAIESSKAVKFFLK